MLIVGLGNPGSEYIDTRHNIGFVLADEIIRRYEFSAPQNKFKAEYSSGTIDGKKIHLVKPLTFMNNSGICVVEIASFYKIPPEEILVIHDDLDLKVGKLRVKTNGGAGGHNGIRSLDSHIGKTYRRLRIGIDHPGDKDKVHSYVLKKFPKADQQKIAPLVNDIVGNIALLVMDKDEEFMTKIALLNPVKKPKLRVVEDNGVVKDGS